MKKLLISALVLASFGASAGLFSSDTDDAIQTIKEGSPDGCPYVIGDMIDSAFTNETWKSGKIKSGQGFYVDCAVRLRQTFAHNRLVRSSSLRGATIF
ncbi:TPA: hypothetical protein ACN34I_000964 [Vibrio parahaemolyticus]